MYKDARNRQSEVGMPVAFPIKSRRLMKDRGLHARDKRKGGGQLRLTGWVAPPAGRQGRGDGVRPIWIKRGLSFAEKGAREEERAG